MTATVIDSITALEGVVGKTPPPMHLKVIDHLDAGALHWLTASPLMFAGFRHASGMRITLGGGTRGFASGNAHELHIPTALLDDPGGIKSGAAFGSLFLIPGIGETLRINGKVASTDANATRIAVEECYGHCAKALIRSELWEALPMANVPKDPDVFITASRFMALATMGTEGSADLSPKGDPAGYMARLEGDTLWFADRPGNRRVDSFRNIIGQSGVALALLIPGVNGVAVVQGNAEITSDEEVKARFAVKGKTPLLAIRVRTESLELCASPALEQANLWPTSEKPDIDPAKLFVEHIKLNKIAGIGAALARTGLSLPGVTGLLKKGLEKDYKNNLY